MGSTPVGDSRFFFVPRSWHSEYYIFVKVFLINAHFGYLCLGFATVEIKNTLANKRTDKRTNKQTNKPTSKQKDRQTDRQIDRQTDRQTDKLEQRAVSAQYCVLCSTDKTKTQKQFPSCVWHRYTVFSVFGFAFGLVHHTSLVFVVNSQTEKLLFWFRES